ncbi:hypothetical protein HGB47_19930 [Leptospira yasudae]|uniref:hypothetical protein n=1 Tax=Leptospira yasudae TaxID=2202201 RepID=UPI001C4E4691|nr:hypothetical protein [Leptospira yasudae]MBW0435880.1 hypothetical protein [Leptospira yasudae]
MEIKVFKPIYAYFSSSLILFIALLPIGLFSVFLHGIDSVNDTQLILSPILLMILLVFLGLKFDRKIEFYDRYFIAYKFFPIKKKYQYHEILDVGLDSVKTLHGEYNFYHVENKEELSKLISEHCRPYKTMHENKLFDRQDAAKKMIVPIAIVSIGLFYLLKYNLTANYIALPYIESEQDIYWATMGATAFFYYFYSYVVLPNRR